LVYGTNYDSVSIPAMSISSYTFRKLKPFIRRDYDARPLRVQLLEEIIAYPHRFYN